MRRYYIDNLINIIIQWHFISLRINQKAREPQQEMVKALIL